MKLFPLFACKNNYFFNRYDSKNKNLLSLDIRFFYSSYLCETKSY